MQALSDIYKKCWLYLISLRHLLDLQLYFDLKFKSLWESCGIEITSANIDLILYVQKDFRILYTEPPPPRPNFFFS